MLALNDDDSSPRLEMIGTMIRPKTSSIIAAVVRTTPKRVFVKSLVVRMVKVVPRLVEQSADPAANACSAVALTSPLRQNERAIGMLIPVKATAVDIMRLALTAEKEVDRPPVKGN